jgi:hypothetical protein
MLKEYTKVSQTRGAPGRRRWFSDDELDLIVWYADSGAVTGFQLCYDRSGRERAFTWDEKHGMSHALVDGGEQTPLRNDSPILTPSDVPPDARAAEKFKERASDVEYGIVALVLEKLEAFRRP